jgi:hypothetical protein
MTYLIDFASILLVYIIPLKLTYTEFIENKANLIAIKKWAIFWSILISIAWMESAISFLDM